MTEPVSDTLTTVAGRRVKVVRGTKSQTINVCTSANEIGVYDVTYRLRPDIEVTTADLAGLADLPALDAWALAQGGDPEVPGQPGAPAVLSVPAPGADDAWVLTARAAVDRAITKLAEQFLEDPYLHRVEHSLHTALHSHLKQETELTDVVQLASTGHRTQLVHKEWPETIAEQGSNGMVKKGNFDIGILSPAQVSSAMLKQFRAGRIDAPLAIEVGLDYGVKHLKQDAAKLLHREVPVPYLLHLSRIKVTTQEQDTTERLLCEPAAPLRTAYVHIDPATGARRFKLIEDSVISTA